MTNFNAFKAFGFDNGYITIFKGDQKIIENYCSNLPNHQSRYAKMFGWFIPSTNEIPFNIPAEMEPIVLSWTEVCANDTDLKPYDEVAQIVDTKLYDNSNPSEYQGAVGDRLDLYVILEEVAATSREGYRTFIFTDANFNVYAWHTASNKELKVGQEYHMRGTVVAHKEFNRIKQTYINRPYFK